MLKEGEGKNTTRSSVHWLGQLETFFSAVKKEEYAPGGRQSRVLHGVDEHIGMFVWKGELHATMFINADNSVRN